MLVLHLHLCPEHSSIWHTLVLGHFQTEQGACVHCRACLCFCLSQFLSIGTLAQQSHKQMITVQMGNEQMCVCCLRTLAGIQPFFISTSVLES